MHDVLTPMRINALNMQCSTHMFLTRPRKLKQTNETMTAAIKIIHTDVFKQVSYVLIACMTYCVQAYQRTHIHIHSHLYDLQACT